MSVLFNCGCVLPEIRGNGTTYTPTHLKKLKEKEPIFTYTVIKLKIKEREQNRKSSSI